MRAATYVLFLELLKNHNRQQLLLWKIIRPGPELTQLMTPVTYTSRQILIGANVSVDGLSLPNLPLHLMHNERTCEIRRVIDRGTIAASDITLLLILSGTLKCIAPFLLHLWYACASQLLAVRRP